MLKELHYMSFNPRTHEGCDTEQNCINIPWKSFNPRTHEGCDWTPKHQHRELTDVSIHAPMKGATCILFALGIHVVVVSIHAPMKGATWIIEHGEEAKECFNPRTHEGCDLL